MNALLTDLTALAVAQFWQVTAVCVLVGVVTRLACRHRPHLAYLLWMLVVVKAITPPLWASPAGVFSWMNRSVVVEPVASMRAPIVARAEPSPASEKDIALEPIAPSLEQDDSNRLAGVEEPPRRWPSPAVVIFAVWLAGVCGLSVVVAGKWWRLRRRWLAEAAVGDAAWEAAVAQLARELGLRRRVRVVVSGGVDTPAVFGVGRPTILLPADLVVQMPAEALRPILAHELIHVRRGDLAVAMLQVAAQLLWWFHPLIWWANREARRERERACDEEVVAGLGLKAGDYARSLLTVLEARAVQASMLPLPTIGMFGVTARRLEHLMHYADRFHRRTPKVDYALALLALAFLLPGAGLKVVAQAPLTLQASTGEPAAGSPVEQPAPNQSPAGQAALAKLKALGANWYAYSPGQPFGAPGGARLGITFGSEWKGTGNDWKLLEAIDHPEQLMIHLQTNRIDGLAEVHPTKPLAAIMLNFEGPDAWASWIGVSTLDALPACSSLILGERETQLAFGDYHAILALEPDVEELFFTGKAVQSRWVNNPVLDRGAMETNNDLIAEVAQRMKHLKRLTVAEPISAGGLAALGKIGTLQVLTIKIAGVKSTDVEPLSGLTQLETLLIHPANAELNKPERTAEIPLGDAILRAAAGLPRLKMLDVGIPASGKALGAIAAAKNLQTLSLELADVSDADLPATGRFADLKQLSLGIVKLSSARLAPLEKLTGITDLTLPGGEITDADLAHLKPLVTLRRLAIERGNFTGAGLAAIGRLPKLESLDLSGGALDDAGCRALPAVFPHLTMLNLVLTKVTDAGLDSVAKLPDLNILLLDHTAITDAGLAKLKPLKQLRDLRVSETKVTPDGIASLKSALPNLMVAEGSVGFITGTFQVFGSPGDSTDQPADEAPPAEQKK